MSDTEPEPRSTRDDVENTELASVVLDRLLPVIGEFLRADALRLGLDHTMLAVVGVLGIVSPLSVASLAGRCAMSHAATARAVGRLVERGYAERVTDEGDGRSTWWVGRTVQGDETLEAARAGLRADLVRVAAELPPQDRLVVLRALPRIVETLARHAYVRRESQWRETQYRRWQERQRPRY